MLEIIENRQLSFYFGRNFDLGKKLADLTVYFAQNRKSWAARFYTVPKHDENEADGPVDAGIARGGLLLDPHGAPGRG